MNGHAPAIDSAAGDRPFLAEDGITVNDVISVEEATPEYTTNPGDVVDAEIIADEAPKRERPEPRKERPTRTAPPNADEWLDFFSRIVLRTLSRWYVDLLFRDIDEDELTETEIDRLILSQEERETIAQPWAEFATKNKYLRKHGRSVVAAAGSIESFIILGTYIRRVNKIAAKHRKTTARVVRSVPNVSSGPNGQTGANQGPGQEPPGGVRIVNPGTS